METTLLVLEFVLTALITIVVMLQKSSSIGLGAYSGSNESVFGAKGPTAFLAKVTMILATIFVINTIGLSYVYSTKKTKSVIDSTKLTPVVPTPAAQNKAPTAPPTPPAIPAGK